MDPYSLLQPPTGSLPPGTSTTPTPVEIQNMYDYAKALQGSKLPVSTWPAGVSNMLNALMGGLYAGKADAMGRIPQGKALQDLYRANPPPANMPASSGGGAIPFANTSDSAVYDDAPSAKPASSGGASDLATSGGSDDTMQRMERATSKQESGGNYQSVGPETKYGRALGKYQIMPENVERWSKEFLGKSLTPQEFLSDPAAQDTIYRGKMGQYVQKYGVEGAARAWLGGEGGVNHPERRDVLGTSIGDYGRRQAALVGGGGPVMAFSGSPDAPNAADAITMALSKGGASPAGGVKPLPGPQAARAPVAGSPTGQIVSPGALPGQSQMTRANITNIMTNPSIDPAIKAWAMQMYMGTQVNPREVPVFGGKVIVAPNGEQYAIPDLHWSEETGQGGAKRQVPQYITPGGGALKSIEEPGSKPAITGGPAEPPPALKPVTPIIIPGGAVPTAAPPVNVAPVPPAPPPGPSGALPAPAGSPALAFNGGPTATAGIPSPLAQAAAAAQQPPAGPAGTGDAAIAAAQRSMAPGSIPTAPPPQTNIGAPMGTNTLGPLGITAPQQAAGTKVAESSADWHKRMNEEALAFETRKADIPIYQKASQQYMDLGIRAAKQEPVIAAAAQVVKDPRFYSGFLAEPFQWAKKGLVALNHFTGLGPNDKALAAPLEIFEKIISGDIVSELKTQLGGLGQIRLAEINLISQSVANKYNTPAANAAVLMLMQRQYEQVAQLGKIAEAYGKGYVFNDKDQPVLRNTPTSTAGLEGEIRKYTERHPLLTDDEIKNVQHTFDISKPVPFADAAKRTRELTDAVRIEGGGPAVPEQGKTYPKPTDDYVQKLKEVGESAKPFFESRFGPGSADQYLKGK